MLVPLLLSTWLLAVPQSDALAGYLDAEASVNPELDRAAARGRFEEAAAPARACPDLSDGAEERVRCLMGAIGSTSHDAASPRLGRLLVDRAGNDVAVGAAVLLLQGEPDRLEAAVLPSHVLLAVRGDRTRFFDLLDSGRELTLGAAFARYGQELMRAERSDATHFQAYYVGMLAGRAEAAGDSALAERLFLDANKRAPRSARLRFEYGTWLLKKKRYEEARKELGKSTRMNPDHADAWMNRGTALLATGRLKPAKRSFAQMLRLEPNSKRAQDQIRAIDAKLAALPSE